jgi:hypothetical protein
MFAFRILAPAGAGGFPERGMQKNATSVGKNLKGGTLFAGRQGLSFDARSLLLARAHVR